MRYPVNTSMRPSSMRTGTSTWTSRNGCMRMCRMYSSRLIRLAARSNWLATMDFPDIVARGGATVTEPPSGSAGSGGLESAAGQSSRRVLGLGQGARAVDPAGAPPPGVGEYADHIGAGAGRLGRVFEHEYETRGVLGHGGGERGPPPIRRLRALGHDQRAAAWVEPGACDERRAQRLRQGAPDGKRRAQADDLPEAPARSRNAAASVASSGAWGAASDARTTAPVSANQRSAGASSSGRRGA